ncbi:MAG TPA: hypothetical protein VGL77_19825 [Armatimonadota bacterium]|jgi:hypothetical protein
MGRYIAKADRQRYTKLANNLFNTTLRGLDADEQRVYFYLALHPAQTALGCYVLSIPALADDLGLSLRRVKKIITSFVSSRGFIAFDENSRVVWVKNHFDLNPICNGKSAVGATSILKELPNSPVFLDVAREILRNPLEDEQMNPQEKERWITLLLSLQEKAGAYLPGFAPAQDGGEIDAKVCDTVSHTHSDTQGGTVSHTLDYTVCDPRNRTPYTVNRIPVVGGLVVELDTNTDTPPPVAGESVRWPLLGRFSDEVAKYNARPLADAGVYPAATLEGVESNLRDLQAAAQRLQVDDVQEITLRLRRPTNLADLRQASCPAVIIGRMAEYALRDLRERLEEEDYRDATVRDQSGHTSEGPGRVAGARAATGRGRGQARTSLPPGCASEADRAELAAFTADLPD